MWEKPCYNIYMFHFRVRLTQHDGRKGARRRMWEKPYYDTKMFHFRVRLSHYGGSEGKGRECWRSFVIIQTFFLSVGAAHPHVLTLEQGISVAIWQGDRNTERPG